MLTQLTSFATIGLTCERITVEVGTAPGESKFFIVGLGDTAVQESKHRVLLAIRQSGFRRMGSRVITVNLAPADLRKVGPRYDLPIALGLLIGCGQVTVPEEALTDTAYLGELALDGTLRHVSGVLPATIAARKAGIRRIAVPAVNAPEAMLISGIEVIAAESLPQLIRVLNGEEPVPAVRSHRQTSSLPGGVVDFADVRGQEQAKRALTIAAAGGHNVLLSGTPGSGKTLLARAFRGILPPLSEEEAIEVTQIYSIANLLPKDAPLLTDRPFRVVHHTASGVSIVGGGQVPGPGEISLAHKGVLFLDELAEFPTQVLEVLRQPLEDRTITITRAQGAVTFPADFILVAAMNPPQFSAGGAQRIRQRISAPLLDRIDLTVDVQAVPIADLQAPPARRSDSSSELRAKVEQARIRQHERFSGLPILTNREMGVREIDQFCPLDQASERILKQATERLGLSARGYHRMVKVARTIADLEDSHAIQMQHVAEALQYRQNVTG